MEIVLNEREWIESAVSNYTMGDNSFQTIRRYARYLYDQGYRKSDARRAIEEFIIRCDPSANLLSWQAVIERAIKQSETTPLIQIGGVSVTDAEMEAIDRLGGKMAKKLMFTLVCLAKYRNLVRPDNNNWVSVEMRDIFRMADIKLPSKRQALLLNDMYAGGYIGYSRTVNNTSINVKIVNDESDEALLISDFRSLGNQYMMAIGENYIHCSECGLVIKKTSNIQKYCKRCAEELHRRQVLENYHAVA